MQIVMQWVLEGTLSWNSEHVRLIAAQTTPPNYSVVAIAPWWSLRINKYIYCSYALDRNE